MNRPETYEEWESYVGGLYGPSLRSKAIAANSQRFVDTLLEEGKTTGDFEDIITLFVDQLVRANVKCPEGGVLDMVYMSKLSRAVPLSDEALESMNKTTPEHIPDDIDAFIAGDELEDAWDAADEGWV